MYAIISTVAMILELYKWVFIIMIIMSWLFSFNVINSNNQLVSTIWRIVSALTEPVLAPIRKIMPNMGGLDLSPIIVFIGIFFLQSFVTRDLPRMIGLY